MLIQFERADRAVGARQADDAAQTTGVIMKGLRPAMLQSIQFQRLPQFWRIGEYSFFPDDRQYRMIAMRYYRINIAVVLFVVLNVPFFRIVIDLQGIQMDIAMGEVTAIAQ